MRKNSKYLERAKILAEVIDIAFSSFNKFSDPSENSFASIANVYAGWKDNILNSEPQFANLASLKHDENMVFTFFNESAGPCVEYFWSKIKERELPFEKDDKKIFRILKRNKIRDFGEFEYVRDVIVPFEQQRIISSDEAEQLGRILDDFEFK